MFCFGLVLSGELVSKYDMINAMRSREISDLLPLITLSKFELGRIMKRNLTGQHEIYHISDALKVHLEKTKLLDFFINKYR